MVSIRRKGEDSLKVTLCAVFLAGACSSAAHGQPAPLVVGVVRDQQGQPVGGASVRAFDSAGREDGSDMSEGTGTFAVSVPRRPERVEISCRYCETRTFRLPSSDAPEPLVVIVKRYSSLSPGLAQRDLQMLPYRRTADALTLVPYLLPRPPGGAYGANVSDRGLDLGYSAVLDQGVADYDLSGQATAFSIAPDRSVQRIDVEPASQAYRYGTGAGGGTFVLDARGEAAGALSLDTGFNGSVVGYERFGGFAPAAAQSQDGDDGAVRRRAGLDYETAFAGGVLRAVAAAGEQDPERGSLITAVNDSLLHLAYATASRRYLTFADASASQTGLQDSPVYGDETARSTSVTGSLRVEHPGALTTAFGLLGQRYTGSYTVPQVGTIDAWLSSDGAYLEANGGGTKTAFDAGVALSQLGLKTLQNGYRQDNALNLFVPSLSVRQEIANGFALRTSFSESFRVATLAELFVMPDDRNPFERGSLLDAGIDYDDAHRVRVGTMVFRESLSGFANRQTTGFGFSLAWQFAPLLSLRAWTLHDAAQQSSAPLPYIPYAPLGLSRSVVWFSYDNSPGVRFDAIVHRDVFGASEETDVDGGIALPIARGIALTFGTQRSLGRRSVYAGLRLP